MDFGQLERTLFMLNRASKFNKAFLQTLHTACVKKPDMLNEKEIQIPEELIKKYSIVPIKGLTEEKDGNIYFDSKTSHLIKETFGVQELREEAEEDTDEYKTERTMLGLLSREEFTSKYPEQTLQTKEEQYEFVPTSSFTYYDFCVLANKYPSFKFLMNPFFTNTYYSTNTSDALQRVELDVKRKVSLADKFGKKIVTKFSIPCKCGKTMVLYPNDIHTSIKHVCGTMEVDGKETQIKTTLDKSGLCPVSEQELFLYECRVQSPHDRTKSDNVFFYSFKDNLLPGIYEVDVWNVYIWDIIVKKYIFFPIILGFRKKDIKIDKPLLIPNHPKAIEYCEKRKLPYARFLDVLFSWRDVCTNYAGRDVNNKGMLLQLFLTTSALAKMLFYYDKLGISVVGNKSLSKTYPSYLAGSCYDIDFEHIGSSQDVSLAGLRGGINNNKLVNGQATSMFEKGVFSSAGMTLFDEGEKFYEDKDMNMVLKTFLDGYIDIKKIGGGQKVEQTYTPLIMSNFVSGHSQEYFNKVRDNYEKLVRLNNEIHEHGSSKEEISVYVADVNIYLPVSRYIEDYKNQTLSKAVALTRHMYSKKQVDWRTGGSMPASYRLLLDVVCWNSDEFAFKPTDRVIKETESVLPSSRVFPTLQFVESMRQAIGGKTIDLRFMKNNSIKDIAKLELLESGINEWFTFDKRGQSLFLHLSEGKSEIDPKLNGLVYKFIRTLQCYEDLANHGELKGYFTDNIKEWTFLILSKCKRGVTKDEYNFEEHYTNIVPVNEKFAKLEAEIEKISNMEKEERLENMVERKINQKEKESMAIELEETKQGSLFNKV